MKFLAYKFYFFICLSMFGYFGHAQEVVPILSYAIDNNGNVSLEIASDIDHYYILKVRHSSTGEFELSTSMTLGEEGLTIITETLGAYPLEQYQVLSYDISSPFDTDQDDFDDILEFDNRPQQSPLNAAPSITMANGAVTIEDISHYRQLAVEGEDIPWAPFLNGREFIKFGIIEPLSEHPKVYFINTESHDRHWKFYNAIDFDFTQTDHINGEIIYHPQVISDNGTLGEFSFAYSQGLGDTFEIIQKTHELLALNMPFIKNNLSYFVTANGEDNYFENEESFNQSRVAVLFESDVYAEVDFLSVNPAEGYGLLRVMDLEETPSARDIVIYESLPNNLPRVGGIITSFIQTPLSHVNLRAIQDNIPNAYIREPLEIDVISALEGKYIHYKVDQNQYLIEESTLEEVNAWYEANRPNIEQLPPLNLSYREILPLDDISFGMSDGFGAKCTNVATMLTFDFPENTTPEGFGVPFYFYQEFMKFNGFFERIETMIANTEFQSNIDTRVDMLKDLRRDIKDADMPHWMLDELQEMHKSFPPNTSIRVRSSTNNEDLPGFSGAGLYTSKTQKPDEGHISKSIKQVYASMWNFRAFDEREYYRVNHFIASMGALCHPNYKEEKANGVAVSTDPIYQSENTLYLNTQVGEDLVTNPDAFSIPEEILLSRDLVNGENYVVIRRSNQLENDDLIMGEAYLDQLRNYLNKIHDEFAVLYDAVGNEDFAMDIEYKITSDDRLIIKQARPWSSYWTELSPDSSNQINEVVYFPNPTDNYLNFICNCPVIGIRVTNMLGQKISEEKVDFSDLNARIHTENWNPGLYIVSGVNSNGAIVFSNKILKK